MPWSSIAGAAPQRLLEIGGAPVLAQEVAKSFVRELLKAHHAIPREQVERMPCLEIELDALALDGTIDSAAACGPRRLRIPLSLAALTAADHPQGGRPFSTGLRHHA